MAAASPGPEHFEHLRHLLVLERRAEEERLAGERAQLSQGERESLGLSAGDLQATDEDVGLGGRFLVTLARAGGLPWRNPFGPGVPRPLRPSARWSSAAVGTACSSRSIAPHPTSSAAAAWSWT